MSRGLRPTALADMSEQLLANPYPVYHMFRKMDPVHWSGAWDAWFLTRHEDVQMVMKDSRFSVGRVSDFSQRLADEYDMSRIERTLASWILFMDPPPHTRLRALISRAFTPRTLERSETVVKQRVNMLLDAIDQPQVNILEALASPLPVMTIADILGARNQENFQNWSHRLATFLGAETLTLESVREADEAIAGLTQVFSQLVQARKSHPEDDLISSMLAVELSDQEVVDMCTLLFAAGHDTTTNLIANGILALLQHPGERKKLEDPAKAASAVEEVLRWDSPALIASRHAMADVTVGDKVIRAGQLVNVAMAGANRDPAVFPDPDRFLLDRPEINKHIAFGKGIHTCVGNHLARLEARIAFSEVLSRWPELRLAGPIERYPTVAFRRLKQLTVELR